MKSETDIQDRIRYLLTQELDRRVAEACVRLPHKCLHNHRHPLDVRKHIAGEPNQQYNIVSSNTRLPVIGLCMLDAESPEQWNGTICEDPIDAQRCPYFNPMDTKLTVQASFQSQIQDLVWLQIHLPEVYGLLWSISADKVPSLPWWKVIWFRFIRVRPDPIRTPSLPPPSE